mgnify:CR=1 FL=1
MPTFDIVKKVSPKKTFRVANVMGRFDLQSNQIEERFTGSIEPTSEWQIGLIIGKSGTGKTTIAKQLYPNGYITNFNYSAETILDDMPESKTVNEITKTFNAVGFSSPPSWLKPYDVLSSGEKMRVNLARAILSESDLFVFDEFTSVVDRQVAQVGSFAMQKSIRKTQKKFIAVTCHFDVEDWLLPDWVFETDTMTFRKCEGQKKNRPELNFKIYETTDKKYYWKMFTKYHYLNHKHNNAARVFICTVNDIVCGFCSVFHFPHSIAKNIKKVHRIVMLPDYQGLSLGIRFLNEIGKIILADKNRYTITTSSPSLVFGLKKEKQWRCINYGRKKNHSGSIAAFKGSENRFTTSWEMIS